MSKRLFLAITIKPEALLLQQKAFLRANLTEERINWVKEENMHLTLKFIGKTAGKRIPEIIEAVSNSVLDTVAFPMILERIGLFGSSYNARVVWLGVRENQELHKLQQAILHALENIGYPIDRQNFVPHFTLGRIKKIQHKDHFKRVMERVEKGVVQEAKVDGFVLYESILTPEGPIYKLVKKFEFKRT